MQWFQDKELWQLIIEILAVMVGILLPIGLYLWEHGSNRKRFGYWVESVSPLFNDDVRDLRQLEVTYNGKAIPNPYSTVISFYNLGRLPITSSDFEQHLVIETGARSVLAVVVTRTAPPDMDVEVLMINANVRLTPLLLNGRDSFTLSIITEGESYPSIRVRLVGVSRIEELPDVLNNLIKRNVVVTFIALFGMIAAFVLVGSFLFPDTLNETGWKFLIVIFAINFFLSWLLSKASNPIIVSSPRYSSRRD